IAISRRRFSPMASGKRASMREGPLAALFRRTDEDEPEVPGAKRPEPDAPQPPADDRRREPEREAPQHRAPRDEPQHREPPAHPRDTGYPHPSLGATPAPVEIEEPRLPTPQERLRHAFTSDIPENILEPPADEPYDDPARGVVSSDEPAPWGQAKSVGQPVLRVVGVGGAGVNAVNRMVEAQIQGVEFVAINTDLQSLQQSTADITLHIGPQITRGLGAGSNPDLGRAAAMDESDRIKSLLKGSEMIFIAAGAG